MEFTKKVEIDARLETLKKCFQTQKTAPLEFRLNQLRQLCLFLHEHEGALVQEMCKDFKAKWEAILEVRAAKNEVIHMIDNLPHLVKPESLSKPMAFIMDKAWMQPQAKGVVLIISPWNYPITLLFNPLVGAMAAGCCAMLKPSEHCLHTNGYIAKHLPKYIDKDAYSIVSGAVPESTKLLQWPHWDQIFYTGSTEVGRIVHQAAAKSLTPTIMELGGKCPVWVGSDADLKNAARRIVYGKLFNAGQTCLAPDYVIVSEHHTDNANNFSRATAFKEACSEVIREWWGDDVCTLNDNTPNEDYSQIVNEHHYERIMNLLKSAEQSDTSTTTIQQHGAHNKQTRRISPTIILNPPIGSALMKEEIFGPLLPIISLPSSEAAIDFVNQRPNPLTIYLFTNDRKEVTKFTEQTRSGSLLINDTMTHIFAGVLPLGGIGSSGHGKYGGRWSFEAFTHQKPAMWRAEGMEWVNDLIRNPPLDKVKVDRACSLIFKAPHSRHLP